MDEQAENQHEKDLPKHPLAWFFRVSSMHPVEIIVEIGKFKEASRKAHLIICALGVAVLFLAAYFAMRV